MRPSSLPATLEADVQRVRPGGAVHREQRQGGAAEADDEACSVIRAVETIGSRWRLVVLHDLQDGEDPDAEKRFNELERSTDASSRTLSRVLDDLGEAGLLNRRVEDRPLATYYSQSEKGLAQCPVFEQIDSRSDEWLQDEG